MSHYAQRGRGGREGYRLPPAGQRKFPPPSTLHRRGKTQTAEELKGQNFIAEAARSFWGPHVPLEKRKLDSSLVKGIYDILRRSGDVSRPVTALEISQYLENYLWPNYGPWSVGSKVHMISIVLMVNEKYRERVPPWEAFKSSPEHFCLFFRSVLDAFLSPLEEEALSFKERTTLLIFLVNCFNSLEVDIVREQVQKLVSLHIWSNLYQGRLEQELQRVPKLRRYWLSVQRKYKRADEATSVRLKHEQDFLWKIVQLFYSVLDTIPLEGDIPDGVESFCERFLELMTDLEAQLPTRRFFNTLLDDAQFVVRCFQSSLAKRTSGGHLFRQLLERLSFYCKFEINDFTGEALSEREMVDAHYSQIVSLQRAAFKLFPDLRQFALSNVAGVDTRESLYKHFRPLNSDTLHRIAAHLYLVPPLGEGQVTTCDPALLLEVLVARHCRRPSQLQALNTSPLYPTEEILWDENVVPYDYYEGDGCLALPKLNLQFLTLHDYLLRNFTLFRLESTYEIRDDIEDVVTRMRPWINPEGETQFAGWARMAQVITAFSVVEVGKPKVGENRPSRVRADVTIHLAVKDPVRVEWEGLRKHDVCFLVAIQAQMTLNQKYDWNKPFVSQVGLVYVRGCEIEGMLDDNGKVIEETPYEPKPEVTGELRTFRVWLDTNQYQKDMESVVKGGADPYESFNILMRRKPKENNFKSVLESIRDLMNTDCVVPDWLHDIFLGYGDPGSAHYTRMPNLASTMNFNDTFLSLAHLRDSFPQYRVECSQPDDVAVPPFKLTFVEDKAVKRKHPDSDVEMEKGKKSKLVLQVVPYSIPNRGPYPYNLPKKNSIPFTPTQVEAIRAGMNPGLTMIVGPPGTGKTDVAVQIISNLYHNYPDQRTLLVTHSNQALNQLFEKIMALDVDERHLLRLGHGEESLRTEKDFSRFGRVNFILALRLELLKEVERLQYSLDVTGDVAYTCETAGHFFLYQVVPHWEKFCSKVRHSSEKNVATICKEFPFTKYFSNAPQPLFKGNSFAEDWDIAEGCFRHIKKIFKQLEEFRAFELLRTSRDRINFLLVKEAKIIALTCTHAALKRRDLVELAFKYDNVLMEEAAQILEVETFIPLMLQTPADGMNRLKRVILIGDHHQLPPVIKNQAFQKFSNMAQSMFTRFVRLGVPVVQLDAQGRARSSLSSLYKWRYQNLGDLPHILEGREYSRANPGFVFDYQLINVEDFNGIGETTPTPYFFQNLAEAEYAVALFMYMRLQGYPPEKIAILTTYNGQKHLIRDVLQKRCSHNPVFGLPEKVTTVDRYQGQQNDYIILSLVRSKHVGHLRDVRRLVVAMSRARLGLYILARVSLFQRCGELSPTFDILVQRPLQLHLVPSELCPTDRLVDCPPSFPVFPIMDMPQLAQFVYQEYHSRLLALEAARPFLVPPPSEVLGGGNSVVEETSILPSTKEEQEAAMAETQASVVKEVAGIPSDEDVPDANKEAEIVNEGVAMDEQQLSSSESHEEVKDDSPRQKEMVMAEQQLSSSECHEEVKDGSSQQKEVVMAEQQLSRSESHEEMRDGRTQQKVCEEFARKSDEDQLILGKPAEGKQPEEEDPMEH